ncbi:MAG: proton-conducting transporter membrane subunit, partial [Thermoanaerobaculia bacterium]
MLVVLAVGLLTLSGLPALFTRSRAGEYASVVLVLAGAGAGLTGALSTLTTGTTARAAAEWNLPGATLALRLDPLAAAFLLPIFVLGALASVYGLDYWPAHEHASAGRVRAFTGVLLAGMATVVVAANGMLFLVAWEAMALAAFFLIAAEDEDVEARGAAWLYLVATHIGTLLLFALFVVMRAERGTFLLGPLSSHTGTLTSSIVLLLAVAGFGFKAGIVPLHFWLPGAHANAPSHVSAMLSGAMLKVGVYGIIRVILFLPDPQLWWGGLLIVLGLTSALVAIALAIGQSDVKRTLAYSSIENVGIITVAIGLGMIGRATGLRSLAILGFAAAIAHVWSHSLFKGLLFLCAGCVVHATGTRRLDHLGGLLHRMPVTGALFVVGAAAASALPGLNAFVSEWMLYVGLIGEAPRGSVTALAAAVIALVGALAVACFVRLTGAIFLGSPRSDSAATAHEASLLMRGPMVLLAIACIALGVFPAAIAGALETITGAPGSLTPLLRGLGL